jgi:hypothetical protein
MSLAAILAPLVIAAATAQAPPVDVPLSIVVREGAGPGRWDLELTNTGTRPVVAWAFEVMGADGRRTGSSRDVFSQLLGDHPDDKILHPGVPTVVAWQSSERLDGATITPAAVIYADATAIGDAERIEFIFAGRRAKAEALADVIPKLEALAQAGLTAESLEAASVALGDPSRRKRGSHVYQGLANNLTLFSKSPTPEVGFHHMLDRMRRELQLAKEHSFRRR